MILNIVGAGIKLPSQITLGGMKAVRDSKKVLSLVSDRLPSEVLAKNYENINYLYQDGDIDINNYDRIVRKIISDTQEFKNVTLLVYGHPRVGVTIVQTLQKVTPGLQIDLRIHEGVSSFDTMINDVQRDPLESGSVMIDANRLLLFDIEMVPELDYYIYHVCSIGTAKTNFTDPSKDNALKLLIKKILAHYPENHLVRLVSSAQNENAESKVVSVMVKELEVLLEKITFSSSLYIPSLRPKKINRDFLKLLQPEVNRV